MSRVDLSKQHQVAPKSRMGLVIGAAVTGTIVLAGIIWVANRKKSAPAAPPPNPRAVAPGSTTVVPAGQDYVDPSLSATTVYPQNPPASGG